MTHASPTAAAPPRPPSRLWYVLAVIVLLAAIGGFTTLLFAALGSFDQMIRMLAPGQAELKLDRTGSYTIFHEHRSTLDGRVYDVGNVSGLAVTVTSGAGGANVPLQSAASTNYSSGSRAGRSLFSFEIREPGVYRLSASYRDGRKEPQTVLAVGHQAVSGFVTSLLAAMACLFAGLGIAVGIIVIVAIKRRKALSLPQRLDLSRPPQLP